MGRKSDERAGRGETIDGLEVLRWAHGGEGVAQAGGRVVFVADVVPGDVVAVEVTEAKARWARGRVTRRMVASPERVPVACAIQERCGGCPWMPGSAAVQAASRRKILHGELKKRLGLDDQAIAERLVTQDAPARFGYRQRVRLTFSNAAGQTRLGFLGKRSHRLVDVARCEVADERINQILPELRQRLLALGPAEGRVTLLAGAEGVAGWVACADGRAFGIGERAVTLGFGAWTQRLGAEAFAQANAAVTGQLLDVLLSWAARARGEAAADAWAVELFAGAGTLTLALWRAGWRVMAYEVAEAARAGFEATRQAAAVAPERGIWHAADLTVGAPLPAPPTPALVVLDPPRGGAAEVMPWVRAAGARHVIYVSCDLATGLRDVATLTRDGVYRVAQVVGLDMFPHSGHQEVMVLLTAAAASG